MDRHPGVRVVADDRHGRAIRELPLAERPRERLAQRGVAGLTSAELIGLVWGSGSRGRSAVDIAADALARHEGLTGLARATDIELARRRWRRTGARAQLAAAFELGRRLLADWPAGVDDPRTARRRGPARSSRWAASSARSCAS